jgi:hypothetical protein
VDEDGIHNFVFEDTLETAAADFDFERARAILTQHRTPEFWNIQP